MMDMQELNRAGQSIRLSEEARGRILAGCAAHRKSRLRWQWVAAAACGVVILGAAAFWQPSPDAAQGQFAEDPVIRGGKDTIGPGEWEPGMTGLEDAIGDMTESSLPPDEIFINECGEELLTSDCALYYDPELYEEVSLTEEEIEAYYGRDIGIDPVPGGLQPDPRGVGARFVKDRATGEWVYDVLRLSFWSDWGDWENGGAVQMLWEGGKGFFVTMSRNGIVSDCIVVWDEDMVPSTIAGYEVTIGHRTFGTQFDENNQPRFEYPVYVAKFTLRGVEYEVMTENLGEETLIEILHTLLDP